MKRTPLSSGSTVQAKGDSSYTYIIDRVIGDGASSIADFVGSTTGILKFCRESEGKEFIIGTEIEIVRALQKELPDKKFYEAKENFICEDMKKNTLSTLLSALKEEKNEIILPEEVRSLANVALENMIRL